MQLTKTWIHAVWSTKDFAPLLSDTVRTELFLYLKEVVSGKFFTIDCINGTSDHIHCLALLPPETSVAKLIFVLREQSRDYINKNKLSAEVVSWNDDYVAVSVSESLVEKTRDYIMTQNEIHNSKSFLNELNEFIDRFKFNNQNTANK